MLKEAYFSASKARCISESLKGPGQGWWPLLLFLKSDKLFTGNGGFVVGDENRLELIPES